MLFCRLTAGNSSLLSPQESQLNVYTDALERINASIAFKGATGDTKESVRTSILLVEDFGCSRFWKARLVEAGARKLTQLYTKLVAEASSGAIPARSSLDGRSYSMLVPFSDDIVQTLLPLVTFLRTMPLPATHPSHPAANAIQTTLSEAQRGYADMRSGWIRRCLEPEAKRVVEGRGDGYASGKDTDAAMTGIREGQDFGVWVERVIDVAGVSLCFLIDDVQR